MPTSESVGGPYVSVSSRLPELPPQFATPTLGSGYAPFESVKKYLSDKPLRIRVADDPRLNETIFGLAQKWQQERLRGADIHEIIESPSYQEIVKIGQRAIRPLLLMVRRNPDHWFPALVAITRANPVPAESEGRIKEMADAWIKWGKERGYIRELD
jgi:hypothetical protein